MVVPFSLSTERLTVRLLLPGEGRRMAAYYRTNRDHLQPFYPRFKPEDFEDTAWESVVPAYHSELRAGRSLRTVIEFEGEIVGVANLTSITGSPRHCATLGYSLAAAAEGQGLMREALAALLDHAVVRFGLHRIEAAHLPRNARSARTLAALGFEREGLARDYMLIDGNWEDHVLTARLYPREGEADPPRPGSIMVQ